MNEKTYCGAAVRRLKHNLPKFRHSYLFPETLLIHPVSSIAWLEQSS